MSHHFLDPFMIKKKMERPWHHAVISAHTQSAFSINVWVWRYIYSSHNHLIE